MTATPTLHNLGCIRFGIPYTIEYILTNDTENIVTIDQVVTSCSACTKASVSHKVLAPHTTTSLVAVFIPGSLGPQTKAITIISYSGATLLPTLKVKFKATVNE